MASNLAALEALAAAERTTVAIVLNGDCHGNAR
jgi:hypothetical protein